MAAAAAKSGVQLRASCRLHVPGYQQNSEEGRQCSMCFGCAAHMTWAHLQDVTAASPDNASHPSTLTHTHQRHLSTFPPCSASCQVTLNWFSLKLFKHNS